MIDNIRKQSRRDLQVRRCELQLKLSAWVTLKLIVQNLNSRHESFNPLSGNPTKWSNTLKQFVGSLPKNCLGQFDNFVGLALKGLSVNWKLNYHLNKNVWVTGKTVLRAMPEK